MTQRLDDDFVFSATTHSLSHISSILNSLTSVNSQVLITIDEDGLNFITEYSHICRGMSNFSGNKRFYILTKIIAEITLEKSLFTTYQYNPQTKDKDNNDDTDDSDSNSDSNSIDNTNQNKFAVDLTPIAESLSLASKNNTQFNGNNNNYYSQTECTIFYKGSGYPFILIFEDNKMIERCEFSTFINLELEANNIGFELNQNDLLVEGIIKSDVLYDALKDLKDINSEQIYIYATSQQDNNNNNNKSYERLALISKSEVGNSTLYLPNEKSILEKLIIYNNDQYNLSCYEFNIFNKFLKSIKLSNKCKFKKDSNKLSLNLLSLYGFDLPKNYTGTIFDFKILQKDFDEPIENLIPENEKQRLERQDQQVEQHEQQHEQEQDNIRYNLNENQYEEEENGGIDVPIFI
ncbi:DNA damage checkpoint control protein RAD17 [Wickerhamomyces ciferrii]|uniref:DNA damage checkpoint control protein RAD17 n=1 Tax=Wickerhamomyces ciferrii (strain ATCC 14091 / BCRC 22168 / CBS 111 / JCM 3599 / NBRC 0793 / NRRL Y-1031 F-60-10) TaxID=1206466 RepID=K0KTE1_WICCF|nr:DNA damage checkpoint control protein RAD17 [Wickerhamomyces ciferrii]CCH44644.1 DNA damage checkpoint control protein RAD17 [Wickerhamomyces ciferrii]